MFCVVSDPVDPLCRAALLEGGLSAGQIRGFGLGVMDARARYYAARDARFAAYLTEGRAQRKPLHFDAAVHQAVSDAEVDAVHKDGGVVPLPPEAGQQAQRPGGQGGRCIGSGFRCRMRCWSASGRPWRGCRPSAEGGKRARSGYSGPLYGDNTAVFDLTLAD